MTEEQLKKRKVTLIDIAVDKGSENKPETDPSKIHSARSGRGPLTPGWIDSTQPMMCCYKLATIKFNFGWMLSDSFESVVEKVIYFFMSSLFTNRFLFPFLATIFDAFGVRKKSICSH